MIESGDFFEENDRNNVQYYWTYDVKNKKYIKSALMIGSKHPLYTYIEMFIKMNEINFKK